MLIGLDFDNTLARYDGLFATEAKKQGLVSNDWQGTKKKLKNMGKEANNNYQYRNQYQEFVQLLI